MWDIEDNCMDSGFILSEVGRHWRSMSGQND